MPRRLLAPLAGAVLALGLLPATAGARLEVSLFARVPAPGYPADVAVGDGGTVYVSTFKSFSNPSDSGPSKVFAYSPSGALVRTYTVAGQTPGTADAVQVTGTDGEGRLVLLDQDPPRVVLLDPRSGEQRTWATFATLPVCTDPAQTQCSPATVPQPPEPDFSAWGPDGSLYVTDYNQDVVWRVPPGGGAARVWLSDTSLAGVIVGPAGIALLPGGHALLLDSGAGSHAGNDLATGKLYRVPIEADGRPGALQQLWESAPGEAPDGFGVAASGDVYVALIGPLANAIAEISPQGREIARVPTSPAAAAMQPVPFDSPGNASFDGEDLLVGNQASITNDSSHWAVLRVAAGEPGLPPSLPPAATVPAAAGASAPTIAYRLRLRPARLVARRRTLLRFTVVPAPAGRRAWVRFDGRRAQLSASGHAQMAVELVRGGRVDHARLIVDEVRRASASVRVARPR